MTLPGKRFLALLAVTWALLALISVNKLVPFWHVLTVPTFWLGMLAWGCFTLSILVLGFRDIKRILLIFCLFFLAGYVIGPFLEPPGDPLDHLRLSYSFCDKQSDKTSTRFKGLWQYSMNSTVLCSGTETIRPEKVIQKIDLLNGLYWGYGASILYLIGTAAGLPFKWSLLSVFIAFLFMGTNRFSYFSYYSFAPSFTSMWVYWLWTALFFFRKSIFAIVTGVLAACLVVPVILVNHIQEAVFLGFLVVVWLILNSHQRIWGVLSAKMLGRRSWQRYGPGLLYMSVVLFILFILPQSEEFRKGLAQFFIYDNWDINQEAVFSWRGWHIMGKIWGYRVNDTLGLLGLIPVVLLPFFALKRFRNNDAGWHLTRIAALGIIPLLVFCIPLFHYIWLSNCEHVPTHIRYYYRICYSSLFWIPITFFLYRVCENRQGNGEAWRSGVDSERKSFRYFSWLQRPAYWLCLVLVFGLSTIRMGPIYGKMDFILVDSRAWWKAWQPMITDLAAGGYRNIFTDFTSHTVLRNVFNIRTKLLRYRGTPLNVYDVRWLNKRGRRKRANCLVNLRSFSSTWVPGETGHWKPDFGDTTRYYVLGDLKGDALIEYLREHPLKNCYVYY